MPPENTHQKGSNSSRIGFGGPIAEPQSHIAIYCMVAIRSEAHIALFPQFQFPDPAAGWPQPAVNEGSNGGAVAAIICVMIVLNAAALLSNLPSEFSGGFWLY